jgi:hypothetical protein
LEEKIMSRRCSSDKNIDKTEPTVTQELTYLKVKPFDKPSSPAALKLLTEHFLFGEWRRSAKGGVVCADEEVIKEQKRILKLVFTRIGSNIFKGNSCMNVSLPIQLFRNEYIFNYLDHSLSASVEISHTLRCWWNQL